MGSAPSAKVHANLLSRATADHPARGRQLMLQMQRQYGNRYVQRVVELSRQGAGEAEATPEVEAAIEQARGGGRSLDAGIQRQMESAFGTNFSGVRVHTDSTADALNQSLSARAFTTGQDIFFRQGEYNPGSSSGKELLAHELTHVVQQTGTVRGKLAIGQPDDAYEQEADQVAKTVMQMEQASSKAGRSTLQGETLEEEELVQTKTAIDWLSRQIQSQEEEDLEETKTGSCCGSSKVESGESEPFPDQAVPILTGHTPQSKVLRHLQTLEKTGEHNNTTLYRKAIDEFQQGISTGEITGLQRQILESSRTVGVHQKDRSPTLRRSLAGCTPSTSSPPVLRKRTVSGPTPSDCGGFSWGAQWYLDNATSSTNGWIVQKVELVTNVTDCSNSPVDIAARGALNPAWYPIWEAWQVRSGSVYVGGSTSSHRADTYGSPPVGDATKGSITVRGTAEYYDGLTLPSSFTVRNAAPAWSLPVTTSQPTLTGGTGSLAHNLTATWNCCTTTKTTSITTV
ncbi:MAG TPA: hypothetical protein DCE71_00385 [Parachlamydiales bacterium]|nr:hypothetical protein [Parachlamydiales bacterium]